MSRDSRKHGLCRSGRARRYEPAPRRTAADEANDVRSLERALDEKLFMLVRSAGAHEALADAVLEHPCRLLYA